MTQYSENVQLVMDYIDGYNNFDLDKMMQHLADEISFKNIVDGKVNLSILGRGGFKEQAMQAMDIFSQRKLDVLEIKETNHTVELSIHYTGVLRMDLPQGAKAGDHIDINGQSIFDIFEGQIYSIQDIS